MKIALENLELLPQILEKLTIIEQRLDTAFQKRWLNVTELSTYLGYSKDRIYALKDNEFIEGVHYYKKGKLLFDRYEIDKWVMGIGSNHDKEKATEIVNRILDSIK